MDAVKGWTLDVAKEILEKEVPKDTSMYVILDHLKPSTIILISKFAGDDFLDGKHNEAWSPREFINRVGNLDAYWGGYLIGPDRDDERISLDKVWICLDSLKKSDIVGLITESCPDETDVEVIDGKEYLYMWWD